MNVIRTFSHKALFPVLILASCCVTLPAFFKSFSLFLLFLVLALSGELFSCKYKLKSILRFDNPLLWLVGLYLLYCVGMLWTKDVKLGFDDLVIKLPMLVVPVLFLFVPKRMLVRRRLWLYAFAFVCGLVVFELFLFAKAVIAGGGISKTLYNSDYINFYHYTYRTLACNMALVILYKMPLTRLFAWSAKRSAIVRFVLMALLNFFVVTMYSRMGFFLLLVADALIVIDTLFVRKVYGETVAMLAIILLTIGLTFSNDIFATRYKTIDENAYKPKNVNYPAVRPLIYSNALNLIGQNPILGAGTGDVKQVMNDLYKRYGVPYSQFNAHNQFLQTAIALGCVGLLLLLMIYFCFALRLFDREAWLLVSAVLLSAVCMLTESVLERQMGVHLCVFAYCWFNMMTTKKRSCKSNSSFCF